MGFFKTKNELQHLSPLHKTTGADIVSALFASKDLYSSNLLCLVLIFIKDKHQHMTWYKNIDHIFLVILIDLNFQFDFILSH